MIRFAVFPGWVMSKNDGDRHFINAHQIMHLYRVNPRECLIVDPDRDIGYGKRYLDTLMPLRPMQALDYRPVSPQERRRYPLDPKQHEHEIHKLVGEFIEKLATDIDWTQVSVSPPKISYD